MLAVLPGFTDSVFDGQRAFRSVLTALSEPGRPVAIVVELPDLGLAPSAAAAILALADIDTPVWLSPSVHDLRAYLRFHTGAPVADDPANATFAVAANLAELPPLGRFNAGTAISPETSATVLVVVDDFTSGMSAELTGPGIATSVGLAPAGFDAARWAEVVANHERFPRGIDLLLCCGHEIVGLPRSTRITTASATTALPTTTEGVR